MVEIVKRVGVRGAEYCFRFEDRLYVFKSKKAAEIALMELENGKLL